MTGRSGQRTEQQARVRGDAAEHVGVGGRSDILLLCDHASRHVPAGLADLGLSQRELSSHIGWDIGAADLTRGLAQRLDATAVLATFSRLVIDANRRADAPDLIAEVSDHVTIPGNAGLGNDDRAGRLEFYHAPYHDAIDAMIRTHIPALRAVVSVHSFTPRLHGEDRPWHLGILFDGDDRLARALYAELAAEDGLVIGLNAPYAPSDGVYYTVERHAVSRGLLNVMLEIRNDLLADPAAVAVWADRLAQGLTRAVLRLEGVTTEAQSEK